MQDSTLALSIALLSLVATLIFIGYALTGADLCLWCA